MTYRIGDLRNLEANIYYYIASGLSNNYGYTILGNYGFDPITSGIYLVDGYPDNYNDVKLPSIAPNFENLGTEPYQLGPGKIKNYRFSIDIFGRMKGEREDLSEKVLDMVDYRTIPIYDYNDVYRSDTYTQVGLAEFEETFAFPIRDQLYETTKFMNRIICTASLYISTGVSLV